MGTQPDLESKLDGIFAGYKTACPDVEGAAGFVPGIWARIEARRKPALVWRAWTRNLIAATAALCFLLALFFVSPTPASQVYNSTYLDELDHEQQEVAIAVHPAAFVTIFEDNR